MKLKYIIVILILGAAIATIISVTGRVSSYVTFEEAKNLVNQGFNKHIHVVGHLPKSEAGQLMGLKESPDRLTIQFQLIDQNGHEERVFYANPIPPDFDKSEQVVIIGKYEGEVFIADKILLKCPSKYQEESTLSRTL